MYSLSSWDNEITTCGYLDVMSVKLTWVLLCNRWLLSLGCSMCSLWKCWSWPLCIVITRVLFVATSRNISHVLSTMPWRLHKKSIHSRMYSMGRGASSKKCSAQCTSNEFQNAANRECETCHDEWLTCNGTTINNCETCRALNSYSYNGTCTCISSAYWNVGAVLKCIICDVSWVSCTCTTNNTCIAW